jgi:hypothetical protein
MSGLLDAFRPIGGRLRTAINRSAAMNALAGVFLGAALAVGAAHSAQVAVVGYDLRDAAASGYRNSV